MGSRIMHYCITTLLSERLAIRDNGFLLGGLTPDVHKYMGAPKQPSHFLKRDAEGQSYCESEALLEKYPLDQAAGSFYLGYYFHLLSDDIWLKDIYYKKIKGLPPEEKQEAQKQYYRDFWRLNGKLIDYYSLELIIPDVVPVAIDEIDTSYLPLLLKDLERDFEAGGSAKTEPLELLDFAEIIQVLEKSVACCMDVFKQRFNPGIVS
jgi:hypothetical protein